MASRGSKIRGLPSLHLRVFRKPRSLCVPQALDMLVDQPPNRIHPWGEGRPFWCEFCMAHRQFFGFETVTECSAAVRCCVDDSTIDVTTEVELSFTLHFDVQALVRGSSELLVHYSRGPEI